MVPVAVINRSGARTLELIAVESEQNRTWAPNTNPLPLPSPRFHEPAVVRCPMSPVSILRTDHRTWWSNSCSARGAPGSACTLAAPGFGSPGSDGSAFFGACSRKITRDMVTRAQNLPIETTGRPQTLALRLQTMGGRAPTCRLSHPPSGLHCSQ